MTGFRAMSAVCKTLVRLLDMYEHEAFHRPTATWADETDHADPA